MESMPYKYNVWFNHETLYNSRSPRYGRWFLVILGWRKVESECVAFINLISLGKRAMGSLFLIERNTFVIQTSRIKRFASLQENDTTTLVHTHFKLVDRVNISWIYVTPRDEWWALFWWAMVILIRAGTWSFSVVPMKTTHVDQL